MRCFVSLRDKTVYTSNNDEIARRRAPQQGFWMGSQRHFWCSLSLQIFQKVFINILLFNLCSSSSKGLCFFVVVRIYCLMKMMWICRATGEKDVAFKVLYCGICHSDVHMVKNEWGFSIYPLVPGYFSINSSFYFVMLVTINKYR